MPDFAGPTHLLSPEPKSRYAQDRKPGSRPRSPWRWRPARLPSEWPRTRRSSECGDLSPGSRGLRTCGGGTLFGVRGSGRETLPSFGAAPLDHESAAARPHADEEAVGPSPATIVWLERSLHCFCGPLRKVEPWMLSVNASTVKTSLFPGAVRSFEHVMVTASRGDVPARPRARFRGSLVDPRKPSFLT